MLTLSFPLMSPPRHSSHQFITMSPLPSAQVLQWFVLHSSALTLQIESFPLANQLLSEATLASFRFQTHQDLHSQEIPAFFT